MQDLVRELP